MKTNPPYLLIAVIFVIVMLYSTIVSTSLPVIQNEGFTARYKALGYSTNPQMTAIDSYRNNLIQPDKSDCAKAYGFDGLYCQPDKPDNNLDIFSNDTEQPG